ncbi:MAG: phosphatase PAP2 family protein [Kiritimatiellales bacterium]|nr:phosphatase PAP2 family protein [Kiritimatiellales bacterium]
MPNGRGWGQDATLLPGWDRVGKAAMNAVSSPHVWIPTGAALLLQIDDADERISDWAAEETPVFGSSVGADDVSDALVYSTVVAYGATVLATPSGDTRSGWSGSKLKGVGVGLGAIGFADVTTQVLKNATERRRPNDENDKSFPSSHAAIAAVTTMLAYQNTDFLPIQGWSKTTFKTVVLIVPYASGWARVEAEKHYPADVLAGVAIGNFFAVFFNDAFLGIDSADDMQVAIDYVPGNAFTIGLSWRF